jgi:hypothetical protein
MGYFMLTRNLVSGDVSEALWQTPPCCMDQNVSMKLRNIFRNAADMASTPELWDHLRDISTGMDLSNMGLERQLAQIRRNTPGKHPLLERVLGTGTLCQYLTAHCSGGGLHPLTHRRADLVADGVPLVAAGKAVIDGRKCRANVLYAQARYQD